MQEIFHITQGKARIFPDIKYPGKGWIGFVPPVTGDAFSMSERDGYYWMEIYQASGADYSGDVADLEPTLNTVVVPYSYIPHFHVGMEMISTGLQANTRITSINGNTISFAPNKISPAPVIDITFFEDLFDEGLNLKTSELFFFPKVEYDIEKTVFGYQHEEFGTNIDGSFYSGIARRPYNPNQASYNDILEEYCRIRILSGEESLAEGVPSSEEGFEIQHRFPIGVKIKASHSLLIFGDKNVTGNIENYYNYNQSQNIVFEGFDGIISGYTFESNLNNFYKMYSKGKVYLAASESILDFGGWSNIITGREYPAYGSSERDFLSGEFFITASHNASKFVRTKNVASSRGWAAEEERDRPPEIIWDSNGEWVCYKKEVIASGRIPRNPYIDIRLADFYSEESGIELWKATGNPDTEDYELYAIFPSTTEFLQSGDYNYELYSDLVHGNVAEIRGFMTGNHEDFEEGLSEISGIEKQFIFRDYEFNPSERTLYKSRAYKVDVSNRTGYSPFAFHENGEYPKASPTGFNYPSVMVVDSDNPDNVFYAVCQFSDNAPLYGAESDVFLPDFQYTAKILSRCQNVVRFSVGTGFNSDGEATADTKVGRYQADGWAYIKFIHSGDRNSNRVDKYTPIRFMSGNSQNPTELLANEPSLEENDYASEIDHISDPYDL